jgi:hypothetical protein
LLFQEKYAKKEKEEEKLCQKKWSMLVGCCYISRAWSVVCLIITKRNDVYGIWEENARSKYGTWSCLCCNKQ